ncbi:MAG TPA: hypothetical protein VET46_12445 [Steroidobacteraceae bacterium]|nr:hypothetical protein [Steroidobacteraceae bacterium]
MGSHSASEVWVVRKLIASLPAGSRCHVEAVAAALRQVASDDDAQGVELAFTLVLAELMSRADPGVTPMRDGRRVRAADPEPGDDEQT